MRNLKNRSMAMLLVLVLCISLIPAVSFEASAASDYIYNWGTRGEVATSLSTYAEDFYESNNTSYDLLSSYSGGNGTSGAPTSDLYYALQNLMEDNHSYKTSYDATKSLFQYTDCQGGGGKISSFYSGNLIGPSYDDGGWNREHTWPKSKSVSGSDENDLMMLRPTSSSENSSRGNMAYGEGSGYYNPNSESGGKYDLRGDVARIFLYVYVRWDDTPTDSRYTTWGVDGIFESLDLLLEWMEADPVDTWELGRNDSAESILGTRNVFVDYPELAFLLFNEEIPADMTTPSGEAGNTCDHNNFDSGVTVAATCTSNGYTLYTCQTANCGYSYKDNITAAKGHNYVSGTCTICGETKPVEPTYVTEVTVGKAYKLGFYSTAKSAEYYFTGTMNTVYTYYGATDTAFDNGVDVYAENATGGYRLYFVNNSGQKQYINLVQNDTHYNFTYSDTATSVFTWDTTKYTFKTTVGSEICYIGNFDSYVNMGTVLDSKYSDTSYVARLYTLDATGGGSTGGGTTVTPCTHSYYTVVTLPTCTVAGYTTYTCSLCSDTYTDDEVAAKGHRYQDGACTACGAVKPTTSPIVGGSATISFASTAARTSWDVNQQTWEQDGVKLVNNKAASQSNVADYSDPARFYAASAITITAPGNITKIEFECNNASYASTLKASIGDAATVSDSKVTVTLDGTSNTFTIAKLNAQVRANSVTVTYEGEGGSSSTTPTECQHTNVVVDTAVAPTCTSTGFTEGKYCSDCGDVIIAQQVIPALEHKWTAADCDTPKTCSACKATEGAALGHNWVEGETTKTCDRCGQTENIGSGNTPSACTHTNTVVEGAVAATCTSDGHTGKTRCTDCNTVIDEGQTIRATKHRWTAADCDTPKTCSVCKATEGEALGHNWVEGKCDRCGQTEGEEAPAPEGDETTVKDHSQCKVSPFRKFWNSFFNFFRRIFTGKKKCPCGEFYE